MKKSYAFVLLGLVQVLMACHTTDEQTTTREGYRPIYLSREDMEKIVSLPPQPLKQPGKIYVKGDYLFVNEIGKGFHIINNRNPTAPQRLGFVSVPGNVDLAAKGDILYVDNALDMVALDVSDPTQVRVLKRTKGVFQTQQYPSQTNTYFECVDPNKGAVVGWEKTTLQNPKCRR